MKVEGRLSEHFLYSRTCSNLRCLRRLEYFETILDNVSTAKQRNCVNSVDNVMKLSIFMNN